MGQSSSFQSMLDRARQGMYAAAFVAAIGSLWTIAWANSLDDRTKATTSEVDRSSCPLMCDDNPTTPTDLPAPDSQHQR